MEERKLTKEEIDLVRGIEGFPIAIDEDIIALSRPPYYTACPNPFIADFICEHGTPYDEATDDYHREPFAADVSEGKNDPIYNAHGYHTKVPYKAIMRYILHYTNPGDVIFDGFCGTGMAGVAAQMCKNPDVAFQQQIEKEMPYVCWGSRRAILNDLSPAATFISHNYNAPANVKKMHDELLYVLEKCEDECAWLYETSHIDTHGKLILDIEGKPIKGRIEYTIWSDVLVCPSCSSELNYWDVAIDANTEKIKDKFICPHCGGILKKSDCEHAKESVFNSAQKQILYVDKQVPVSIHYSVGKKRFAKAPDEADYALIEKISNSDIPYWYPTDLLPDGDKMSDPRNRGIVAVDQYFTTRNLYAMSVAYHYASGTRALFAITAIMKAMTKMFRWAPHGKHTTGMPGTLYFPSVTHEYSIMGPIERRIKLLADWMNAASKFSNDVVISCGDVSHVPIPDSSIDYIFTDPPFGSNLNYSELSFLWEAWLRVVTNTRKEAIISKKQKKDLFAYRDLMENSFIEYYRVLKPGRWITIEFHNSQNSVWNAIQESLMRSGFVVADVRVINKQQGSYNQTNAQGAVQQDLVISAYKPKASFVRRFTERAGDPEMAWEFVRQHLQNVPIVSDATGKIEVISERQDYLLFDRMVAFHIMNGIPVPMDAHSFYAGLRERFIMRDGMFFLADQVNEYDERRAKMELQDRQLSFYISDEKSAILWLNTQLTHARQSYSDIQPKYLQDLHQVKFEQMPELLDMLKENFLQHDDGKWYVPNLSDKADLEKLRRKRLLKDFYDIYAKGTGRIKNARTEAIRVGFDECWKERNYSLIVKVGDRLPETVLQEDPALLMYYDNAANRM